MSILNCSLLKILNFALEFIAFGPLGNLARVPLTHFSNGGNLARIKLRDLLLSLALLRRNVTLSLGYYNVIWRHI